MITLPRNKIAVDPLRNQDWVGSIYVPDQAQPRVNQGTVKYIGPESSLERYSGLKIGDHVLFSGYTGTLVYIEGEGDLIIMHEDFITCILEDDPIDVPGLYFKSKNGEYFQATHEQAIFLCAKALAARVRITKWTDRLQDRPTYDEIEKMR